MSNFRLNIKNNARVSVLRDKRFILKYFIITMALVNLLFAIAVFTFKIQAIEPPKVISCPPSLMNSCNTLRYVGDASIENVIKAAMIVIMHEDRRYARNETIAFNQAKINYMQHRSTFIHIGLLDGTNTVISPQFIESEILLRIHAQSLLGIIGTKDV